MTSRPYELLARFAANGSVAGVSVRTITNVNGRDYEGDPQPLSGATDPAFTEFAAAFSAAIVAQRDQLLADKSALETQVTTLTGERDSLQSQVDQLTTSNAELTSQGDALAEAIATVTGERDSLTQELVTLTSERDTQAQRIIELEGQLEALLHPPGPDLNSRDGVRQFVSNARYVAETGGIYVGNQFISTERDEIGHWFPRFYNAMMWLNGDARIRATNPDGLYPFKPKNHPPTVLTAEQVLRVYECMAWFINACFAAEATLYGRLDANEPLDVIIDATPAAWPQREFTWEPPA